MKAEWVPNTAPKGKGGTILTITDGGVSVKGAEGTVYPPGKLQDARRVLMDYVKGVKVKEAPDTSPKV